MTAIFGTPIAAVLLAVELLLFEWRPRSLIPVAPTMRRRAACRPLLFGPGPLFPLRRQPRLPVGVLSCLRRHGLVARRCTPAP